MSTYNAFYVRKQVADKVTRSAILGLYPKARIETSANFIGGVLSSDDIEPPEQKLSALSAKLATDVIWVTYQTTAGSFMYHHWRDGSHLRALVFGCIKDGVWDRVEGRIEPWEKDLFWNEDDLECQLEYEKSDAKREKLKKLWKDAQIIKGKSVPYPGSDAGVQAIMEHYGLFADD